MTTMTPEEQAVIDAAIARHRYCVQACENADPRSCEAVEALLDVRAAQDLETLPIVDLKRCTICRRQLDVSGEPDPLDCCGDCRSCMRDAEAGMTVAPIVAPEWIQTAITNCLIGDTVRLGSEQTTVTRSTHGVWHVDTSNYWQPRGWDHVVLRIGFEAVPGKVMSPPPDSPIEILCTPQRLAILRIQEGFGAHTVGVIDE